MGPSISDIEKEPLSNVAIRVMNKCGYDVVIPDNIDQFCCGTPFASKGYTDQADYKAKELLEVLYYTTEGGKYDVVFDTSPCAYRIKQYELSNIKIYDPVEFAYMHLIDKINKIHYDKIAIHPTCSTIKSGNANRLKRIAELCSTDVIYPSDVHCCGYAGDKGMYYPELTSNALRKLHVQVRDCQNGFSTSKTCELGLSQSSNIHYKSIFYMLDKCIRM
jgi:D-lactate dehydrogenase